jgi:diaminopimelate decarboxylase
VKRRGEKTWLLVDGGMADNPRFALYGARYSCLPVTNISIESAGLSGEAVPKPTELVSIAGPYCESGDIVIENLPMPEVHEGDLIAIPMAGAYHLSMSSNYNGARRPAVLMLDEGTAELIIERETTDDLLKKNK